LEKHGLKFRFSTKVTQATPTPNGVQVAMEPVTGGPSETIEADKLLVAVGRWPLTAGLKLERINLTPNARGFIGTNHFQTDVSNVWAIGDVTAGPMLAHKAEEDAVACIEQIANQSGEVNYDLIPSVVYTRPEVAWVGKSEEALKEAKIEYKVGKFPYLANSRAKVNHETQGFVKILIKADTQEILGAHMIGPGVSELIAEACLAMKLESDCETLARTTHPHPTLSEALRQAAMAANGWVMQT
jgi:dihydrolipoamide dehydrogenase